MHTRSLSALLYTCLLASSAAAQEMSFARVVHCKNDVGRAELYLPGLVVLGRGPEQVRLGDRTVSGYLAFDFTPVGKNKTLNAVGVSMSEKKDSLIVEFSERGSPPDDHTGTGRHDALPPAPRGRNDMRATKRGLTLAASDYLPE